MEPFSSQPSELSLISTSDMHASLNLLKIVAQEEPKLSIVNVFSIKSFDARLISTLYFFVSSLQ